jgi:hypothetical protein
VARALLNVTGMMGHWDDLRAAILRADALEEELTQLRDDQAVTRGRAIDRLLKQLDAANRRLEEREREIVKLRAELRMMDHDARLSR